MILRVLIYTHDWLPLIGGVQTVTMSLARGVAGWESTHVGERVEVTLVTQTPVNRMDDTCLPFRVVRQPTKCELFKLVRSADVIHVANPAFVPLALGWLLNRPTVLEHDGYQSVCPNGLLVYEPDRTVCPGHFMAGRYGKCIVCNSGRLGFARSLRSLLLTFPRRWFARRAIRNIAPSHHIGYRIGLPRTQIIYHGVPKSASLRSAAAPNRDGSLPCFAYVGRLELEKGVPVLLRASSKLSQSGHSFRLRIIGDGSERSRLERMTQELGLSSRTQFVGSASLESIPDLLSDVTAVVMPSVWEDVAPLTASEQLMQGNLVIASDIGGLGEIVDGAGMRFSPGDHDALHTCMRQVLENPELVNELRAKAHQRGADVFSEGRMVEEHVRLYQELVGRQPT
jgi:glycosyltransferase involved in cell wall biosynthesis